VIHEPDFSLISSRQIGSRAIGVRAMGMAGVRAEAGAVARVLFPETPLLDRFMPTA
jgi:hypothetical protein